MPARVNNARAAEQLRREYDVMGDRLNLQVDDVVVPVAIVSDLTAGASGVPVVRRAYASFIQAAVVAEYCVWRFEAPRGVVAVVRRVLIQAIINENSRAHFGSRIVAPANIAVSQYMDGRLRGEQARTPACVVSYDTSAAGPFAMPVRWLQQDLLPGFENIVEWPMGRGDGQYDFIEFQSYGLNGEHRVTMEWDEYQYA